MEHASCELRNDKEVVLAAVTKHGSALQHASEELRNSKEVVLVAVRQNVEAFKHASEVLQNDKDVVQSTFMQLLIQSYNTDDDTYRCWANYKEKRLK